MGSENKNDRNRDTNRRRSAIQKRRETMLRWEALERRTLLSNSPNQFVPTSTNYLDAQHGPLASEGSVLINVYREYLQYQATGQTGSFATSGLNTLKGNVEFSGDSVGVTIYYYGSTQSYLADLSILGFKQVGISTTDQIVEGFIPIKYLPNLAGVKTTVPGYVAGTTGVAPMITPIAYANNYQGEADNEAVTTLQADVARTEYGVNGAGVTVGVLSTSVNQLDGGIAASQSTGDLPANINVLEDNPADPTDEGRAMLENIYDIAPGASLAFHTATISETDFATGIEQLATQAGAQVEVDDIGYELEPYYSPSVISQAITQVTDDNNVTYFSAAGNSGPAGGIESAFRGVTATLGGVTGTFMQFDPNNAASTTEAFTVNSANNIVLQFDQPFGSGVTSQVNLLIFNSSGTEVFNSAGGNQNNVAMQMPYQIDPNLAPGAYTLAIEVPTGTPAPGRVTVYTGGDYQPGLQGVLFSQAYGNAGGITYPSTSGHSAAADTIGVGASPYYLDPPVSTLVPVPSENFSSAGPAVQDLNAAGQSIPLEVRQEPLISASDGGNTTFFGDPAGDGSIPAGVAINQYNLPNFFGTSSAAPNAAAVAVLMKQLVPSLTSTNIANALVASTIPLNGTAKGTWDVIGGYGLIQAPAALNAVAKLTVTSATPSNGQVETQAPQDIVFTFSRPIDPTTITAADLTFPVVPSGVTISVGTPIYNPATPTVVEFPLTYTVTKGGFANGIYTYALQGAIESTDGRPFVGYSSYYGVADVVAPKIDNVTLSGRYAYIQFSEPMNPATLNLSTVLLVRTGSSGVFNNPTNVIVTADPRSVVTYDAATNTVVLDLSKLNQSELPSDNYNLIVTDSATDLAGNKLDGEYSGTFPTGNGVAGGTFNYYLPSQELVAPQIVTLRLSPASDTGIAGDNNTNNSEPTFIGTVTVPFPGTAAGVEIVAQINALNNGVFDLATGPPLSTDPLDRARGFVGTPEASATTDTFGNFAIQIPTYLTDGLDTIRVVAVGQSDLPPVAGYSSSKDLAFRIDTTVPSVTSASPASGTPINTFSTVTLNVTDPVLPNDLGNPQSVPVQFSVPALNPATADNISNYSLINLGPDEKLGTADDIDESSFITSATFVAGPNRVQANAAYTGQIVLSFAAGLPAGFYALEAHRPQTGYQGITDAAGNPLDGSPTTNPPSDYVAIYDYQPEPAYITAALAASSDTNGDGGVTLSQPRSYFEVQQAGVAQDVPAPPTTFYIQFSEPLNRSKLGPVNPLDPSSINPDYVQLIRSADDNSTPNNPADGDFGFDSTFQIPNGGTDVNLPFTRITGTTLRLINSVPGATFGQPGYQNELVLTLAPGTTLPPDHYRLFVPNAIGDYSLTSTTAEDLRLFDVYGNQVDGEFLGNPLASDPTQWQDLLPSGQERVGLSGDGIAGGAFETSYIVVPQGNVIYARPDYQENPLVPSTLANGTEAQPYPVLAPEAVADAANGGDLNSIANFSNFNTDYDYNGNGHFDLSAFYAAQQLSAKGPVVIVSLPAANTQVSSVTGISYTPTFVLQSKALNSDGTIGDGSASVPFDTDLVFQPGSVLKLYNATLFVQNQGSSIQVNGGANPSQKVTFTSLFNDSVDGPVNGIPASTSPTGGNWGGIALRNFDDQEDGRDIAFPVDGILGVSGADDALSILNNVNISYGGGIVPQGANVGTSVNFFRYDEVTLFDARPLITNFVISDAAPPTGSTAATGTQAAISVDLDSLREDDLNDGALIRPDPNNVAGSVMNNSINGIYVRAEASGFIEQTDAEPYTDPGTNPDGTARRDFDMFAPLPYVLITRLDLGAELLQGAAGAQATTPPENRLYVDPGAVLKFQRGAALEVVTPGASLNIGDRIYMDQFDANSNFGPENSDGTVNTGFQAPGTGDAQVIFTSLFDNVATTSGPYINPATGLPSIIVPQIDSANSGGVNQPTAGDVPALARWGDISVISGGLIVMNDATVEYGGGQVNQQGGTITQRDALNFQEAFTALNPFLPLLQQSQEFLGSRAYITNNNFFDNEGGAVGITPDGLLAADPLRPLESGSPFLRGNIMARNDVNALQILTGVPPTSFNSVSQYATGNLPLQAANLFVNSVWDLTDVTYAVQGTVAISGDTSATIPIPDVNNFQPEVQPKITLTLQSALPGTLLANGQTIAKPGESLIVKLLNPGGTGSAPGTAAGLGSFEGAENEAGAGFTVGYDNGINPTADPYLDAVGVYSQLRITGIAGNESTGQKRVPVVITSLNDNTIGTTVRGVAMNTALQSNANPATAIAPQPGDGGLIVFGSNELLDYNLLDPRDGSIIDNADLSYMTRVEVQGGGIIEVPSFGNNINFLDDKLGITPSTQLNGSNAIAITDSNFNEFSQVDIVTHPSTGALLLTVNLNGTSSGAVIRSTTGQQGQPTDLLTINDTFSNTPIGVSINGEQATADGIQQEDVTEYVALNNTFYNDPLGISLTSIDYNLLNPNSHIHFTAMDNIFDTETTAVFATGMVQGSQGQYNLFSNITGTVIDDAGAITGPSGGIANIRPNQTGITGNADFVEAAEGNLRLMSDSDAIDAARSELSLDNQSTGASDATLRPLVTQDLDSRGGTRIADGRIYDHIAIGVNDEDVNGVISDPVNILTLPGSPLINTGNAPQNYLNEWVAALPGTPGAYPGPATNAGDNYWYLPTGGQRDQEGNLRLDDPNVPNVGTGSEPFFDIGAYEYRQFNPPTVTAVTATIASAAGNTTVPFYTVGGVPGSSTSPISIQVTFSSAVDPSTLTGQTVLLEASGGTGAFGNPGQSAPPAFFINLSGKLSYDTTNNTLTINLSGSNLNLKNDEYRLFLLGTGANAITNPQGIALDGVNTSGDNPNNPTLALPSGADNTPGSNFYLTFYVNNSTPVITPGTFGLSAASITGSRDNVTKDNTPTFIGTITATFPPANAAAGQTVVVDISTKGNGVYDDLDAGTGITGPNGTFSVTITTPLPDSPINVGPDGLLGTADDLGYSTARVRVVDQAGNSSSVTDPNAIVKFVIDTKDPFITVASPASGSEATTTAGVIPVAITVDENLNPATLNTSSILVTRAGPDGVLGTADDVSVPIDPTSISLTNLFNTYGSQVLHFNITGATANDEYQVTLKGTGSTPITDIAANPLAGAFKGTFPTGGGVNTGSDFNLDFFVYSPSNSKILYVDPTGSTTGPGTRETPYSTIMTAMAAANAGDTIAVISGSGSDPNVYDENVVLKPLIRLVSADPTSTDSTIVPGEANETILRATSGVTVNATDVQSLANFSSEISGFTIASPLLGNLSTGPIDPSTIGILAVDSDLLIDKNYIIDSNVGIASITTSGLSRVPRIQSDGVIGNVTGVLIQDQGATSFISAGVSTNQGEQVANNTVAFNTDGLVLSATSSGGVQLGNIVNNIFWQNAAPTTRSGAAIYASEPNRLLVQYNLFNSNGPNVSSPADDVIGVGGTFNPSALGAAPDALGNITGSPAFVAPRDPRPTADGPASFLLDANFNPTLNSAAIDNSLETYAPTLDFLYRARVDIPNKGYPGRGPADLGAFEYNGTPTTSTGTGTGTGTTTTTSLSTAAQFLSANAAILGGSSRVITTSLTNDGSTQANGAVVSTTGGLSDILVSFSNPLDAATVAATDLVLSGAGLSATNPAHATDAILLNSHTIEFDLAGGFVPNGLVQMSIPSGKLLDSAKQTVQAFNDMFRVSNTPVSTPTTTTTTGSTSTTPTTTSAPLFPTLGTTSTTAPVVVTTTTTVAAPVTTAAPAASTTTTTPTTTTPLTAKEAKAAARAEAKAAAIAAAQAKAAAKAAHQANASKPFKSIGLPSYFRRKS